MRVLAVVPALDARSTIVAVVRGLLAEMPEHEGMPRVIVVDTSVWVTALRRPSSPAASTLRALIDADEVALALPVRLELMAGIARHDRSAFARGLSALGAVAILFFLGAGRLSATRLILVGVALSSFAGALIALVMNLAPNPFVMSDLVNWLFGTVTNRSFADISVVAPFMAVGLVAALAARPGLTALALGEDAAAAIGADLKATRALAIFGAALMTGASVALAGAIGFVGIVAPHLARPLARHDPGAAILPSALIGGAMLAAGDLVIRSLPFDQEMKLGVAAALIGAPGFAYIAARTRKIAS